MTFLDFINQKDFAFSKIIYVDQEKHSKKFDNAYNKFQVLEDIVAIIDNSMLKSGKSGIVFTDEAIYVREDFSSPIRYDISDIDSLDCELTLTNNTKVIINGKSVMKIVPTSDGKQSFREIEKIIQGYIKYINAIIEKLSKDLNDECSTENEEESYKEIESNSVEVSSESKGELDRLKRELEELKRKLEKGNSGCQSIIEEQQTSLEKPIEDKADSNCLVRNNVKLEQYNSNCGSGVLKTHNTDFLMTATLEIRNNTQANFAVGAVNFLQSFTGDNSGMLNSFVAKNIVDSVIYVRKEYIDKYNIIELKNDLATMNVHLLIQSLYVHELLSRGVKKEICFSIVREGLMSFYTERIVKQIQYFYNSLDFLFSDGELHSVESLIEIFYLRLLVSNVIGKLPSDNFIEDFYLALESQEFSGVRKIIESEVINFVENSSAVVNSEEEAKSLVFQKMMSESIKVMKQQFNKHLENDYDLIRNIRYNVDSILVRLKDIRGTY